MSRPDDQADRRLRARRAIGEQLRRTRRRAKLSQSELSALTGLGINTITRCERGSIAVTLDTLDRLAEVLHCDFIVAAQPCLAERKAASDRPTASDRPVSSERPVASEKPVILPKDAPAGAAIIDDATIGDVATEDAAAGDTSGYDLDDA